MADGNWAIVARVWGIVDWAGAKLVLPGPDFLACFYLGSGTGMFGLKGVGIVVLTSRTVCCCQMESFLGYMSQCTRSNNVFTMEVQTRILYKYFSNA